MLASPLPTRSQESPQGSPLPELSAAEAGEGAPADGTAIGDEQKIFQSTPLDERSFEEPPDEEGLEDDAFADEDICYDDDEDGVCDSCADLNENGICDGVEVEAGEGGTPTLPPAPEENPLTPLDGSLDRFVYQALTDDVWELLLDGLPCASAAPECIRELQTQATDNSLALLEIDSRIEEAQFRIDEATAQNKKLVRLEVFTPALQYFLTIGPEELSSETPAPTLSPLEKIGRIFTNPGQAIGILLDAVGVPLVQAIFGGTPGQVNRSISISELQIRVAELQRGRAELAQLTRERVLEMAVDIDAVKRQLQAEQHLLSLDTSRVELLQVEYSLGEWDTNTMINQWKSLDSRKVQVFRSYNALRSQLSQLRIIVIGPE